MQQLHQNKQRKKLRRNSYDCSTRNRGNTVVVWHDTAVAKCVSNYAGAALESFIKRWSKAEKKKISVLMAPALMLYNQKMGRVDLLLHTELVIAEKSDGGRFFS